MNKNLLRIPNYVCLPRLFFKSILFYCFVTFSIGGFAQTSHSSYAPSCSISGSATVCPGSSVLYKGPSPIPTGYTYIWTVTGYGTISGSNNGSSVLVKATTGCGKSFTVSLKIRKGTTVKNSCQKIVSVADKTNPFILAPLDKKLQCGESTDPAHTGKPAATDNCDAALTITYRDISVNANCTGRKGIDRVWTATDDCGNYNSCTQKIYFIDKTAPVIYCPKDVFLECDGSTDPRYTGTPTVTDKCDATPTVSYKDVYLSANCSGKKGITRIWTAIDDCGNSSYCIQKITFVDKTPPVIYCPADVVLGCSGSTDPVSTGRATATDKCDATPTITYQDRFDANGILLRTWTAKDDCGNSSYCIQKITGPDKTPPLIKCPADITISCDASTDPTNTGIPVVSDNLDPFPAVRYQDVNNSSGILRTWTAEDNCGNTSYCVQKIMTDKTPPLIYCPADITISCDASTDPTNTGTPVVSDNLDPFPSVRYQDENNSSGILRTWTAEDNCGNTSYCVQKIMTDKTPPLIGCPADITISCDASTDPTNTGTPVVSDNLDPFPSVRYQDENNSSGILRTWTAEDNCGNTSYCVQKIMTDKTPPLIECPADITISCDASTDPTNTGTPVVSDNLDPFPSVRYQDRSVGTCAIERTWTAEDNCGNTSYCVQKISNQSLVAGKSPSTIVRDKSTPKGVGNPVVKTYPSPYSSVVNFRIESPFSGKTSLEIYNLLGQRLAKVFEENIEAGMIRNVQYKVPGGLRATLVYRLTTPNQVFYGILIPAN